MAPMKRLTITQNAQQQNRSVLLAPSSGDILALILDAAKRKLRVKRPSRVFLSDGTEITESSSILNLDNDR